LETHGGLGRLNIVPCGLIFHRQVSNIRGWFAFRSPHIHLPKAEYGTNFSCLHSWAYDHPRGNGSRLHVSAPSVCATKHASSLRSALNHPT